MHRDTEHHRCALVDATFEDRYLRLDCPDHNPAAPDDAKGSWDALVTAQAGPAAAAVPHRSLVGAKGVQVACQPFVAAWVRTVVSLRGV